MHWRRKWQPIPVLLPGESQGGEAWLAAVYGVAQSDSTEATQQQQQPTHLEWPASSFCLSLCVHVAGKEFQISLQELPMFWAIRNTLSLSSCSYYASTNVSKSQYSCATSHCCLTLHLVMRDPIFTLLKEHLLQLALVKISLCSEAQPQICSFW